MSQLDHLIKELPIATTDRLLRFIESQKKQTEIEKRPLPRLTAHLTSGQSVAGEFVAYRPLERNEGAVLLLQSGLGAGSADLTYINAHTITAVTFHLMRDNIHLASLGELNEQCVGEQPTKMQIEREMAEWMMSISERFKLNFAIEIPWDQLPATDQSRFTLNRLLNAIKRTLSEIAGSPLGTEALQEKIGTIKVVVESNPVDQTIVVGERVLKFFCSKSTADLKIPEPAELKEKIEALL